MRFVICGALAGLLLAAPALAQSGSQDNKSGSTQKAAQTDGKAQPAPAAANPPAPPPKDESMGTYDVTGSSANDAMGTGAP